MRSQNWFSAIFKRQKRRKDGENRYRREIQKGYQQGGGKLEGIFDITGERNCKTKTGKQGSLVAHGPKNDQSCSGH